MRCLELVDIVPQIAAVTLPLKRQPLVPERLGRFPRSRFCAALPAELARGRIAVVNRRASSPHQPRRVHAIVSGQFTELGDHQRVNVRPEDRGGVFVRLAVGLTAAHSGWSCHGMAVPDAGVMHEQGDAAARVASRQTRSGSPTKPGGGIAHPGRVAGIARMPLAVDLDIVRLDFVDHQFPFRAWSADRLRCNPLRRGSRNGCRGTSRPLEPRGRLGGVGGQRGHNQSERTAQNPPRETAAWRRLRKMPIISAPSSRSEDFNPVSAASKGVPRGRAAGRHGVGMLTNRLGVEPDDHEGQHTAAQKRPPPSERNAVAAGGRMGRPKTAKRMIIGVHQ